MLSSSFQIRGLLQLELKRNKGKQMGVLAEKAGSLSNFFSRLNSSETEQATASKTHTELTKHWACFQESREGSFLAHNNLKLLQMTKYTM